MKQLLLLIVILGLFSCSKDDYDASNKATIISLLLETENNNDSAYSGTTLYAVQVYASSTSDYYVPHAYGLFDDKSKIELQLPDEFKYKIESTAIINAKALVAHDSLLYYEPFLLNDSIPVALNNQFAIDSRRYFADLSASTTRLYRKSSESHGTKYKIPPIDRYYGEITYSTSDQTENLAQIHLERMVFGINITIDNTTHSTISIQMIDTPDSLVVEGGSKQTIERIYTLPNFKTETGSPPLQITLNHKISDVEVNGKGEYFIQRKSREIITLTVVRANNTKADYKYDLERVPDFY